jgi:hypothetical protein
VQYQFGIGEMVVANEYVAIGTTGGYVVDGVADNLIGVNDLLEAGSYLYLDKQGGVVGNKQNNETIPVWRKGEQMRVWLTDVANYQRVGQDE